MSDLPMIAFRQAIQLAGSQSALADELGITRQAIAHILRQGRVSPRVACQIEEKFGVSREVLAPHTYPRAE
jgi:plasmid maintenance system antidote protein VapI